MSENELLDYIWEEQTFMYEPKQDTHKNKITTKMRKEKRKQENKGWAFAKKMKNPYGDKRDNRRYRERFEGEVWDEDQYALYTGQMQ